MLHACMSTALTVLPHKFASLAKFKKLVEENTFEVSENSIVKVLVQETGDDFPLDCLCTECMEAHNSSGIIDAIRDIPWQMLGTSTYDPMRHVSYMYTLEPLR